MPCHNASESASPSEHATAGAAAFTMGDRPILCKDYTSLAHSIQYQARPHCLGRWQLSSTWSCLRIVCPPSTSVHPTGTMSVYVHEYVFPGNDNMHDTFTWRRQDHRSNLTDCFPVPRTMSICYIRGQMYPQVCKSGQGGADDPIAKLKQVSVPLRSCTFMQSKLDSVWVSHSMVRPQDLARHGVTCIELPSKYYIISRPAIE